MILFREDFKKYPSAIIDVNTKNKSFLRLATVYREMGITNNAFLLALINPSLQGVDPFDSANLTAEQMTAIAIECKMNPWYYFREIARVPIKGSTEPVMFEANRGNIALYWLFFNHITTILIQIRQTGKSVSTDVLSVGLMNIFCENVLINLLTLNDKLRSENIKRIKDIDSELPFYLRQRTKNDLNNMEQVTVKSLRNNYIGHVPQASVKDALNQGRGFTAPVFHVDEGPFQANIAVSLPAALAAGTAARDAARKNGTPYGTILTTTAGKKDDRDGKFIYNLLINSAEWNEKFLDSFNTQELETIIRKSSPSGELRVNCTFNHRQLGKSDAWLKQALEDTMVTGDDANRDFFNVWTAGTQSSPLPVALLEKIKSSEAEPYYTDISKTHGYVTKWYIHEQDIEKTLQESFFVLSMDTSDASGGDDISLLFTDIKTGKTVAAGSYNETNLISLAEWLVTWFVRFENFVAIIERRSTGSAIIDYLLLMLPTKGIDPFKRLFNRCVNDAQDQPERYKEISNPVLRKRPAFINAYKKSFGFATSGSGITSRSDLYSITLQKAAKLIGEGVTDRKTINQIVSLVVINGRVDHQPGEHDDMVIAWLLTVWLLTQGTNLSFYGIDSKLILSQIKKQEFVSKRDYFDHLEQQTIRQEIEKIYEEMSKERDEFVLMRKEQRLRVLNSNLILQEGERFSLDDLINSIREERKNFARNSSSNNSLYNNYNPNGTYSSTLLG
jgi:hypothetical protein